jgi:hypothetical protein
VRRLVLALLAWLALVGSATAAEWGAIQPGASTMDSVRAQYGGPTRTETQKVDGYDTTTWIYEGTQAPSGLTRLVVDFGLLQAGGFQRALVRALRLEPHPGVFTRDIVLRGWGRPTGVGKEGGADSFFYDDGLLVIFDKESWSAVSMLFTLPQPSEQAKPSR